MHSSSFSEIPRNNIVDYKWNAILILLPKEDLNMRLFCFIFKSNYSTIPPLLKNSLEEQWEILSFSIVSGLWILGQSYLSNFTAFSANNN